jgi:hypothetical protein
MEEKDKSKRQCEGENGVEGNQKNDLVIGLRDNVVVSLIASLYTAICFLYHCIVQLCRGGPQRGCEGVGSKFSGCETVWVRRVAIDFSCSETFGSLRIIYRSLEAAVESCYLQHSVLYRDA